MTSLAKARASHGILLSQQGDFYGAAQVLQEALALSRRIGETTMIYFCLSRFALMAAVQGEIAELCRYVDLLPAPIACSYRCAAATAWLVRRRVK